MVDCHHRLRTYRRVRRLAHLSILLQWTVPSEFLQQGNLPQIILDGKTIQYKVRCKKEAWMALCKAGAIEEKRCE